MRAFLLLACLAIITTATAYTDCQQAMYDGTKISWKMAVAYTNQDTNAYNALVDQWNAWVRQNFGEDPALLMSKMTGPVDLSKPYLQSNNTTSGIVHSIDGNRWQNKTYTTNDMNLLPSSVTEKMYRDSQNAKPGSAAALAAQGDFLGGI
jgi:hypothetical protein